VAERVSVTEVELVAAASPLISIDPVGGVVSEGEDCTVTIAGLEVTVTGKEALSVTCSSKLQLPTAVEVEVEKT
jgi:hypothetical protein